MTEPIIPKQPPSPHLHLGHRSAGTGTRRGTPHLSPTPLFLTRNEWVSPPLSFSLSSSLPLLSVPFRVLFRALGCFGVTFVPVCIRFSFGAILLSPTYVFPISLQLACSKSNLLFHQSVPQGFVLDK